MTEGKKETLYYSKEHGTKLVKLDDGTFQAVGANFTVTMSENGGMSISVDKLDNIIVDEFMRSSFAESEDGNIISGSFSFTNGGNGNYKYERGGKLIEFQSNGCGVSVKNEGIMIIKANTEGASNNN